LKELNKNCSEINFVPKSEQNESVYLNEIFVNPTFDENNVKTQTLSDTKVKQEKSNKLNLKLLSSFMFLCATVVILQTGIYIPIFSEIFSPSQPSPTIVIPPTYDFSSIVATENKIDFTLTIDNVDFSKEDYFVYLVKEEDATDLFMNSVMASVKLSEQIKLYSNISALSFTKYMSVSGGVNLKPNTNYAIIVVKDDIIVQKQIAKTEDFEYVKSLDINTKVDDEGERHIYIKTYLNDNFKDYEYLYLQLTNLETNTVVKAYARVKKDEIEEALNDPMISYPESNILMVDPDTSVPEPTSALGYQLKIFCSTDHPENFENAESFVKEEIKYYLIYTHESAINI